jgi:hypothetical protein
MAGVCPACQAWKTTSARAPAVKPVAQEKAPSALTEQALGPGSRVGGAEQKAKRAISCALGRALHGGRDGEAVMGKRKLQARMCLPLFFVVATARREIKSEHCHATVQGLDGAAWRRPQLDVVVQLSVPSAGTLATMMDAKPVCT